MSEKKPYPLRVTIDEVEYVPYPEMQLILGMVRELIETLPRAQQEELIRKFHWCPWCRRRIHPESGECGCL